MKRKTDKWLKERYAAPYISAENNVMAIALVVAERKLRERQDIAELMSDKGKDASTLVLQNKRLRTAINTLEKLIGCY